MEEQPADGGRIARLALYQREASACTRCRPDGLLHQHPDGRSAFPLFHQGAACPSGVLAIAEAPNLEDTFAEAKGHLTLDANTDPTGRFMVRLFASVGLRAEDILLTNAVLCLPAGSGGRHPVPAAQLDRCRPWLMRLISDVDPGVVITFGARALAAVERVEAIGTKLSVAAGQLRPWFGRQLLPLYHPSALGRISRPEDAQLRDIQALLTYLEGTNWDGAAHTGSAMVVDDGRTPPPTKQRRSASIPEVVWRDVDRLSNGHGVNVEYRLDDDTRVTLAFVVGFDWKRGAEHVDVEVLRDSHRVWTKLPMDIQMAKQQLHEMIREILQGGSLIMKQGRFEVIANG